MEESEKKEVTPKHAIQDFIRGKEKLPKKLGHKLSDKRPHFKTFKSPGVK
jgi:hypothetical protein